MTKTINLDGLTSVKIKQSAYDMARFCWIKNLSEADVFASCVNADCTENADEVRRISAGEFGMLDTESYETLYLNGSGAVEIVTSALLVCPFDRGGKGGGSYELPIATTEILGGVMPDGTTITVDENGVISTTGGLTVDTLLDITISTSENSPANGSIITLDGNIFDYKFIYSVPVYNEKVTVFTSVGTNGISFFNPSILTRAGYADKSFQLSTVSYEVSVDCISPTQIKISYWSTPKGVISRVIILGIK